MKNPGKPERALLHPIWLFGLLLLATNDHMLKGSGLLPELATGKISDFAGLLIAPALLATLLRLRSRVSLALAHLAVGVVFTALQLSSAAAHAWGELFSFVGIGWITWRDPSDLLALPMLALSWSLFVPAMERATQPSQRLLTAQWSTALTGLVFCMATSPPPPEQPEDVGEDWREPDTWDSSLSDAPILQPGPSPLDDSDGDGILDREEDINRNGVYEPEIGENDPRNADSDGDGIPDSEESMGVVCTASQLQQETLVPWFSDAVNSTLILSADDATQTFPAKQTFIFSNPSTQVFGYIVTRKASEGASVVTEHTEDVASLAQTLGHFAHEAQIGFEIPSAHGVSGRSGVRSVFRVSTDSPRDPASLRDAIFNTLANGSVLPNETGTPCSELEVHHTTLLRSSGELVSTGAVVCVERATEEPARFFLADWSRGLLLAPGGAAPAAAFCTQLFPFASGSNLLQMPIIPIPSTLKVAVDQRLLPRSREEGWDYDAERQAIVLYGVSTTEASDVAVSFVHWSDE